MEKKLLIILEDYFKSKTLVVLDKDTFEFDYYKAVSAEYLAEYLFHNRYTLEEVYLALLSSETIKYLWCGTVNKLVWTTYYQGISRDKKVNTFLQYVKLTSNRYLENLLETTNCKNCLKYLKIYNERIQIN